MNTIIGQGLQVGQTLQTTVITILNILHIITIIYFHRENITNYNYDGLRHWLLLQQI